MTRLLKKYFSNKHQYQQGSWTLDLHNDLYKTAISTGRAIDCGLYLKYLLWCGNYNFDDLFEIHNLLKDRNDFLDKIFTYPWLIPLLISEQQTKLATDYYCRYTKKGLRKFDKNLMVMYFALENSLQLSSYANKNKQLIIDSSNAIRSFEDYAEKFRNKSIAIVGNASIEAGSHNGASIDQTNHIIRFNNFPKNKHQEDIGTRTDAWVITPSLSQLNCIPDGDSPTLMISGNNLFLKPSTLWLKLQPYIQSGKKIYIFNKNNWGTLAERLEAPPSAGLLLIHSIKNSQKNIDLKLFGFSADITKKNHLSDNKQYSTRHNWKKEKEIIESYRQ